MKFISFENNSLIHFINANHIVKLEQNPENKTCNIVLSKDVAHIFCPQPAQAVLDMIARAKDL